MNGYNFTERMRKVLQMAREESQRLGHEYVGTEHILLAMLSEGEGVGTAVMQNLGIDLADVANVIETTVKKGRSRHSRVDLPYTSRAKTVLELCMGESRDLGHNHIGTEHLLLGLIRENKGVAAQVLHSKGLTELTARAELLRLLGQAKTQSIPSPEAPTVTVELRMKKGTQKSGQFLSIKDAIAFLEQHRDEYPQ